MSERSFQHEEHHDALLDEHYAAHLQEQIDINEAAELLAISPATVRNWVKAGKIRTITRNARQRLFDKREILRLKAEIESGRSHRLKNRRNKKAAAGQAIPAEYVSSSHYVNLAEQIVALTKEAPQPVHPNLILLELALNLLQARGRLNRPNLKASGESLTEQWIQNKLQPGFYQPLLAQLYDVKAGLSLAEQEILRAIHKLEIPFIEGDDLLGLVYLSLSILGKRKRQGSYYTPLPLVKHLVERSMATLEKVPSPAVVDPCCGSGNFLIQLFIALRKHYRQAGFNLVAAEKLARDSLHGDDIDPTAVILAQLNLALHHQSEPLVPFQFNIRCRNTLAQHGQPLAPANRYDLVIGNPPWGYHYTREEVKRLKERFTCAATSLESFALFIEYGLNILKEKGLLTFVLPEALLNVRLHQEIRRLLLTQTRILSIQLLGQRFSHVYTPTIVLMAQKWSGPGSTDLDGMEHHITVEENGYNQHVPQRRFLHNEQYIFNVRASNQEEQLVEQMRRLPGALFLKNRAAFALGIVTGNNKAFVSKEPVPGAEPVLKGSDVFKYALYPGPHYLIFKPHLFQQVAPEHLYRAPEKLVYRFINEHLIFAYDNRQTLSLNSANILIPQLPGYSIKYVLAVLNSRAAQFFHASCFASVKVLRKHIESIPIPPCSPAEQAEVIQWVNHLLKEENPVRRRQIYEQIDQLIMQLYRFTADQQERIRAKYPSVKFLFK